MTLCYASLWYEENTQFNCGRNMELITVKNLEILRPNHVVSSVDRLWLVLVRTTHSTHTRMGHGTFTRSQKAITKSHVGILIVVVCQNDSHSNMVMCIIIAGLVSDSKSVPIYNYKETCRVSRYVTSKSWKDTSLRFLICRSLQINNYGLGYD